MMMNTKPTKEYYLSLPYEEKLKKLRETLNADITSYFVIAKYYLDAPIRLGGLPTNTIHKEFVRTLKQQHYFKKDKTND